MDNTKEISMEKRLKELVGDSNDAATTSKHDEAAVGETLTVLLVQGLHSGDKKILDKVLSTSDAESVNPSVRALPLQSVVPLIQELSERICSKTDVRSYTTWLRYTLIHHSSYLSSNPQVIDQLFAHHRAFETRVSMMDRMLRLQGRLNFVVEQMDKSKIEEYANMPAEFKHVCKSPASSSEDSDADLDDDGSKSDAEEKWDDLDWDNEEEEKEDSDANDADKEEQQMVNGVDSSSEDDEESMEEDDQGGEEESD